LKTAHVVLRVFALLGTLGFADTHAYRPLIILHGFSESGNHAVPQAVKQQALEFGVPEYLIFTPTMPNSAACIESSADWFAGVVNAVLVQTGAAQVDIVAHSLGGIVARTYMKRHNAFRHVRNLVTVASPNHGMRAADVWFWIWGTCICIFCR
jgi:triacylglycerol esterase/lipase EstA (alpha/beta hydrolase family)